MSDKKGRVLFNILYKILIQYNIYMEKLNIEFVLIVTVIICIVGWLILRSGKPKGAAPLFSSANDYFKGGRKKSRMWV